MTPPTARSAPDACSVVWDGAGDATAYGTAAPATFWVGLEQPGPWGRAALTQSRLPADVGVRLGTACTSRGGRLALLRAPGDHPAHGEGRPRQVYVAWTGAPGAPAFLLGARVARAEDLDALDVDALARGDEAAVRASLPGLAPAEPVLLVCTNGRRDVCCAVRGRPVALAGHAAHPGRVWECSHTGGHRFSPTGVLLPWGRTLARLSPDDVTTALLAADAGRLAPALLGPWHDRGASGLPPQAQVAESAVRAQLGDDDPASLGVVLTGDRLAEVTHRDGRRWRVALRVEEGAPRRNSCGEAAVGARTWAADLTPL
ncbi:sucrase ferredoxin [Lapillicoccus jejuensis]|uniref:Sucrase/ferredoxin-like protein n=1 Tax=Lapillicoccus jejuensis TaxID=402171 RepID=A0A542E5I2_9MICO|nr:sucrase ferredoxin [Lapillicoccus jejuensis]TQJ10601.1 hypothetical protein FB458_3730 [Lapillicoccus jejuensis]